MKTKKTLVIPMILGLIGLLLCLPGTIFSGGGGPKPPQVGVDEKLIGPNPHGTLLIGWRPHVLPPHGGSDPFAVGDRVAFLLLEDRMYALKFPAVALRKFKPPEVCPTDPDYVCPTNPDKFDPLDYVAHVITGYLLPPEVKDDFDRSECNLAVIFDKSDVSDLGIEQFDYHVNPLGWTGYEYMYHCHVKVSFICPK